MDRLVVLTGMMLAFASTMANAQGASHANDPIFTRAQALVSDGNGAAGRALIDSLIAATPTGAPLYPQALFWRASLAASAADAESDYRHIVVDYPLAPQAEDALLRLAQLELARGDRDAALSHLQRIQRDYPHSKSLARANYWTARVLFEKNDIPNACAANAKALAQADSGEIELRNQIQYQGQRCPALAAASTATPMPAPTGGSSAPASNPAPASAPATSVTATAPTNVSSQRTQPALPEKARPETVAKAVSPAPRMAAPTQGNDTKPSIVDPEKAPKAATEKTAMKPNPTSGGVYSVQVAAYNHKADAEKLVGTLIKRGYSARVDGTATPFRVRIGRYATENDAENALKRIKAKHMDGFVARVSER